MSIAIHLRRRARARGIVITLWSLIACTSTDRDAQRAAPMPPPLQPVAQQPAPSANETSVPPAVPSAQPPADAPQEAQAQPIDAQVQDPPVVPTSPPPSNGMGLPEGAERIAGIELMQRIVGRWTGVNSNTPFGFDF